MPVASRFFWILIIALNSQSQRSRNTEANTSYFRAWKVSRLGLSLSLTTDEVTKMSSSPPLALALPPPFVQARPKVKANRTRPPLEDKNGQMKATGEWLKSATKQYLARTTLFVKQFISSLYILDITYRIISLTGKQGNISVVFL